MRTQSLPPPPSAVFRPGFIVLAALLVLSFFPCRAQDKPDAAPSGPDLRTLRVDYRKGLLEALLPQKKAYREELDTLEKRLAADSDFNGAIKAREEKSLLDQEIMAMEQELPALNAQSANLHTAALPDKIILSPTEAHLTGLTLDPKNKSISGWKVSRSLATWSLPPLPPGGYEVRVVWSCPSKGSATFMVREARYTLRFKVADLSAKPREQLLGTLKVQSGTSAISLSAENLDGDLPVHIHSVTLVPANR